MIGIIPSSTKTFEVIGDFNSDNLVDGKLYYDPKTGRVYFYSKTETRSSPKSGFFPIWNGEKTFITNYSNKKYFDKDVIKLDTDVLSKNIDKDMADRILYKQRLSTNSDILEPLISDGDNMFTQCIKGIILAKQITMVDLVDMTNPKLDEKVIENYYNALNKITFMRLDKWYIWIDIILHVKYTINVFNGNKLIVTYKYPERTFDIENQESYDKILNSNIDDFKKIIKLIMISENITKNTLSGEDVDDYTINNMMTTINGKKALSSQLFSRFIRMAKLSYTITIYDNDKELFKYKE